MQRPLRGQRGNSEMTKKSISVTKYRDHEQPAFTSGVKKTENCIFKNIYVYITYDVTFERNSDKTATFLSRIIYPSKLQ